MTVFDAARDHQSTTTFRRLEVYPLLRLVDDAFHTRNVRVVPGLPAPVHGRSPPRRTQYSPRRILRIISDTGAFRQCLAEDSKLSYE